MAQETTSGGKHPSNSVLGVMPLQLLLVKYSDNEGKEQVRVVYRVSQTGTCFILAKTLGGVEVAKESTKWFEKGVSNRITMQEPVESI